MRGSYLALLDATVFGATIGKPSARITVNAVPPVLKVGLMDFGVVGNTTVSSD
jgi:hypothetical protein